MELVHESIWSTGETILAGETKGLTENTVRISLCSPQTHSYLPESESRSPPRQSGACASCPTALSEMARRAIVAIKNKWQVNFSWKLYSRKSTDFLFRMSGTGAYKERRVVEKNCTHTGVALGKTAIAKLLVFLGNLCGWMTKKHRDVQGQVIYTKRVLVGETTLGKIWLFYCKI